MTKAEIGGKQVNIPDCWEDVDLKTFIALREVEDKGDVAFFGALTGLNEDFVKKVRYKEVQYILYQVGQKLNAQELIDQTKDKVLSKITIDGATYKAVDDFGNMEWGHFEDMKKYSSGIEQGNLKPLPMLLGIMLMDRKEYDPHSIEARSKVMEKISIPEALMLQNFFLSRWARYLKDMATSLGRKKTKRQAKHTRQATESLQAGGAPT